MAIDVKQVKLLITDVLIPIPKFYSEEAVTLLMMTAAAESNLGEYLQQVGGPALGLMQVEPATMNDNYDNYLGYRSELTAQIGMVSGVYDASAKQLRFNLAFNILMARLKYYRSKGGIPKDLEGMAKYHEKYYNAGGSAEWKVTLEKYRYYCENNRG